MGVRRRGEMSATPTSWHRLLPRSSWWSIVLATVCIPIAALVSPYARIPYAVAACALLMGAAELWVPASGHPTLRRWLCHWAGTVMALLTMAAVVFAPAPLSRPPFPLVLLACAATAAIVTAAPVEPTA